MSKPEMVKSLIFSGGAEDFLVERKLIEGKKFECRWCGAEYTLDTDNRTHLGGFCSDHCAVEKYF